MASRKQRGLDDDGRGRARSGGEPLTLHCETVSTRDPGDPAVSLAPVRRPDGPPVPKVVVMPEGNWRQWVGDHSQAAGGSWLKLLSSDEWPLDGGYLVIGLHPDDGLPPGANLALAVSGGLTEHGPVASISAEWPSPTGQGDTIVMTVVDAGTPEWRRVLHSLAEQEALPLCFCDARTGAFVAQLMLTPSELWRQTLRQLLADTEGARPCGRRRQQAAALAHRAIAAGRPVPTLPVPTVKTGRNRPCPCNVPGPNGRVPKFKLCCGRGL